MKTYQDLNPNQRWLYDYVEQEANASGADSEVVLRTMLADPADKAAVAEVLGGSGAGADFLQ